MSCIDNVFFIFPRPCVDTEIYMQFLQNTRIRLSKRMVLNLLALIAEAFKSLLINFCLDTVLLVLHILLLSFLDTLITFFKHFRNDCCLIVYEATGCIVGESKKIAYISKKHFYIQQTMHIAWRPFFAVNGKLFPWLTLTNSWQSL